MYEQLFRALLLAGLAFVYPAASYADPITLVVGKLLEVTGPLSETGPSQDKAIKLAIDYANKAAKQAGLDITAKDVGADIARRSAGGAVGCADPRRPGCGLHDRTLDHAGIHRNRQRPHHQKKITIWPTGTSMKMRTIDDQGTIFRTVPPDSLQALALVAAVEDKLGGTRASSFPSPIATSPTARAVQGLHRPPGGQRRQDAGAGRLRSQQATFDSEAQARSSQTTQTPTSSIDYPDTYAKIGRLAGAHRQVRRQQACRPRRAVIFTTVPSRHPAGGPRRAPAAPAAARRPEPTRRTSSTSCGRRPAGSSISRSTPTASNSTTLCFLAAAAAQVERSRRVTRPDPRRDERRARKAILDQHARPTR